MKYKSVIGFRIKLGSYIYSVPKQILEKYLNHIIFLKSKISLSPSVKKFKHTQFYFCRERLFRATY